MESQIAPENSQQLLTTFSRPLEILQDAIGKCPRCGETVFRMTTKIACMNYLFDECDFHLSNSYLDSVQPASLLVTNLGVRAAKKDPNIVWLDKNKAIHHEQFSYSKSIGWLVVYEKGTPRFDSCNEPVNEDHCWSVELLPGVII